MHGSTCRFNHCARHSRAERTQHGTTDWDNDIAWIVQSSTFHESQPQARPDPQEQAIAESVVAPTGKAGSPYSSSGGAAVGERLRRRGLADRSEPKLGATVQTEGSAAVPAVPAVLPLPACAPASAASATDRDGRPRRAAATCEAESDAVLPSLTAAAAAAAAAPDEVGEGGAPAAAAATPAIPALAPTAASASPAKRTPPGFLRTAPLGDAKSGCPKCSGCATDAVAAVAAAGTGAAAVIAVNSMPPPPPPPAA